MAGDINRVTLVGRLTRDPELKHLPSGTAVLELGLAVNGRKQDAGGQWVDKPNFFDVKVFGNQAEMLSQHLAKGRRIGVDGRPLVHLRQLEVLLAGESRDRVAQARRVEQVGDADPAPRDLVLVGGSDAAPGGADRALLARLLARLVE